ncbi:hypothetical protein BGZ65_008128, partial [Modicella reniformis]
MSSDHYNENYRKAAMQRFKDVITANNGTFYSWDSRVTIGLASATVAKQFYEALVVARGVQALGITLKWDVTLDDLRMLASVVAKANITNLTMNGEHFKGPVLDMINSGYRYDPILSKLTKLLERCPSLVNLDIRVFNLNDALEDLTTILPILPYLTNLRLQRGKDGIAIEVFQSKIQAVKASIGSVDDLSSDSLLLLRKGFLTELRIRSSSVEPFVSQLTDTIQWNARLRNIELGCDIQHSQTIMDAVISTREEILSNGNSCDLQQFKMIMNYPWVNIVMNYPWVNIVVEFEDGARAPTISSQIRMLRDSRFYSTFCLQYGWSITTLDATSAFTDELADVLDNVTQEKGSKITSLSLDTSELTAVGVECMIRVIDRSQDLQQLQFKFDDLHETHQQEKLERLISRCGKRLNGLEMRGISADGWIPRVMALCPTRLDLPQLEDFNLCNNDMSHLSPDCAQWIAAMVSPPPQVSAMILSSQSNQLTTTPISESSACGWSSLRNIILFGISLQTDDWKVVIKSMDYSALSVLTITDLSFSMDHFKLLVDCIPVNTNPLARLMILGLEVGDELYSQ